MVTATSGNVCCSLQGCGAGSDNDIRLQVYSKEVKTISCHLTATTEPAVRKYAKALSWRQMQNQLYSDVVSQRLWQTATKKIVMCTCLRVFDTISNNEIADVNVLFDEALISHIQA